MVNVLYDFNGLTPWFVPYIGAGVGYVGINENWHTFDRPACWASASSAGWRESLRQEHGGSFAYQAILGAAFPLPSIATGLAITAEYRFFGTSGNRNYTGTALAVECYR